MDHGCVNVDVGHLHGLVVLRIQYSRPPCTPVNFNPDLKDPNKFHYCHGVLDCRNHFYDDGCNTDDLQLKLVAGSSSCASVLYLCANLLGILHGQGHVVVKRKPGCSRGRHDAIISPVVLVPDFGILSSKTTDQDYKGITIHSPLTICHAGSDPNQAAQ